MAEEKLKIYQVKTTDGTLHTIEALYAWNNADKNQGSLVFRIPSNEGKTTVAAEFSYGAWTWYRLAPKPTTSDRLDVDTELGIGSEHLPPRGYKDDGSSFHPDPYAPTDEDRYGALGQG